MVMVIECESCQSRFRLAKALFKESKAIRLRCRKCGGYIVVRNPDLSDDEPGVEPDVPLAVQEPEPPPRAPAEEPVKEAPPPRDETALAMAELLREIAAEPARNAPEPARRVSELPPGLLVPEGGSPKRTEPAQPVSPYPEPPDGSEALASVLEDLFRTHAPPAAGPGRGAAPPAEPARSAEPGKPRGPIELSRPRSDRPPYARPAFIAIAVFWILLLAAAAYLFGTGRFESRPAAKEPVETETPPPNAAADKPNLEIKDVRYFTDTAFDGGKLFAVAGTVTNAGASARNGVRIRATLVGRDNSVLSEMTVVAGNRIDDTVLRHMKREVVESFLTREAEVGDMNHREIKNGEFVPFMAVFFDPPEKIESVLVKAIPAEGK